MQLRILNLLKSFTNTKIVIEKPISINLNINQEIFKIFSNQDNLLISRPWNFSELWLKFKENIVKGEVIKSIEIKHSGEILREYINPPQDWLHHDICLIHDLSKYINLNNTSINKFWSNEKKNLTINNNNGIKIGIEGGYSPKRVSIFEVSFQNGARLNMDMNHQTYSIQTFDGMIETFEHRDDLPINSMADHFINRDLNVSINKEELKILQELQILAI